jgi:hypothetical protein
MKNIVYKVLIIVVSCTVACNSNNTAKIADGGMYTVNLDNLEEVETVELSTVFKKMKTIILETNENVILKTIGHLEIFDGLIFILDINPSYKFVIFDINGRFIRTIGNIGGGPGEYMFPLDFTIDTVKREIYLLFDNSHINKYSIDGKFINKININKNDEFFDFILYHDNSLYVNVFNANPAEDDYLIKKIDPVTGKTVDRFLKTVEYNKGWQDPNFRYYYSGFVSKLSESPKFLHLFTDRFVAFTEGNISTYISVQSNDLVTYSEMKRTEKNAALDRINALNGKIYGFKNYFETKKHISFGYSISTTPYNILIDKDTKSIKKILWKNDMIYSLKTHNYPNFIFSDPNGVYEFVNFQRTFSIDAFKTILLPSVDKFDELQKLPDDSNPVIFYYSYESSGN